MDVYHDKSWASFEGHFISPEAVNGEFRNTWQPHAMRGAWSRDPQRAIAKVKIKLCKARSQDEDYQIADEKRERRKVRVEWNPDEECPF